MTTKLSFYDQLEYVDKGKAIFAKPNSYAYLNLPDIQNNTHEDFEAWVIADNYTGDILIIGNETILAGKKAAVRRITLS